MSLITPTHWTHWLIIAVCIVVMVFLVGRAIAQAWDRTEDQLEYRTASWSDIKGDTDKLQDMVPSPRRSHQIPPHRPPAPSHERRRLMSQHEVAGAAAAIIDMSKGVRRPNPHPPGTPQALGWTFAYEQAYMERDHKAADAKALKAPPHMNLVQCTGDTEFLRADLGDRRFWPITDNESVRP